MCSKCMVLELEWQKALSRARANPRDTGLKNKEIHERREHFIQVRKHDRNK